MEIKDAEIAKLQSVIESQTLKIEELSSSLIKKTLEHSTHSSSSSKERNRDLHQNKNRANSVEESTNRSNQTCGFKQGKKFMATKSSFGKQRGLDIIYMKKNLVD